MLDTNPCRVQSTGRLATEPSYPAEYTIWRGSQPHLITDPEWFAYLAWHAGMLEAFREARAMLDRNIDYERR